MAGQKANQAAIAIAAERRRKVFYLRKAGASLEAISRDVGVSITQVRRDLRRVFDDLRPDDTDVTNYRTLTVHRLEAMHKALWPVIAGKLKGSDPKQPQEGFTLSEKEFAIDRALKISEQLCKLLGLNMPERQAIFLPPELLTLMASKGVKASDLFQALINEIARDAQSDE